MSANEIFTIIAAITATLYFLALIYAASRSYVRRELYVLTALLMAYFVVLAYQVLIHQSTALMVRLFRPSLAALWLLNALTLLVQARKRG